MENIKDINVMLEENERLVDFTLQRYFYVTTSQFDVYQDMKQIGMIALYKAIMNYDETKGEFSTLAVKTIRNRLLNFVDKELYKYFSKGGEKSIHDTEGMDEDSERTRDRTMGRLDDFSEVQAEELLNYIKGYNDDRLYNITILLAEGYTYNEIGERLGLSKQRVGQIVKQLRKKLIADKDKLCLREYDYKDDSDIIDNKKVIAFNKEEDIEFEFNDYIEASKQLGCNRYTLKQILISKKENAWMTCTNLDDIKFHFKLK